MKHLTIVTACACLLTMPAFAEEDVCHQLGDSAAKIMELRQQDAAISDQMAAVDKTTGFPDEAKAMVKKIIMAAYDEPDYSTPKNQEDAVKEFRNNIEIACYRTMAQ